VVLDAAPADIPDPAVDDDHLAMIEMEQVLAMALERPVGEATGSEDHDPIVRHDLDAGLTQAAEEVLAAEIDLAPDGVDRQPDLDASGDLCRQGRQELLADVARFVAVDQQVDVVGRRCDVVEHAREVALSVEQRLDRRADGRRERLRKVGAADPRTGDEFGRTDRSVLGADRVGVERVGRHAARTPVPERGTGRGDGCAESDLPPTAHRRGSLPELVWNVMDPLDSTIRGGEDRVRNGGTGYCNALASAWADLGGYPYDPSTTRTKGGLRCLNSPPRRAACRSSISLRSAATTSCGHCPRGCPTSTCRRSSDRSSTCPTSTSARRWPVPPPRRTSAAAPARAGRSPSVA
jgi:hypothetical protein